MTERPISAVAFGFSSSVFVMEWVVRMMCISHGTDSAVALERRYLRYIIQGQLEVEYVEVLDDAGLGDGLGDNHQPAVDGVSNKDLGGTLSIFISDCLEPWVIQ